MIAPGRPGRAGAAARAGCQSRDLLARTGPGTGVARGYMLQRSIVRVRRPVMAVKRRLPPAIAIDRCDPRVGRVMPGSNAVNASFKRETRVERSRAERA